MKLLVVIPTWNRADYLDRAIQAISNARAQTQNCTVELFVSDNCSSDRTPELLAQWQAKAPWIHVRRWETHAILWVEILGRALLHSGLEYDYLWLQGDDDWITDPSAYSRLADAIEASGADLPALIHCCPTRRALPGEGDILAGTTEDLCNTYGWHDLLGWISSLVLSRDTVPRMMASAQWQMKPPSAFTHSEALLEAAYGQTMLLLSTGLIDPQDEEMTADSAERWKMGDTNEAYWNILPGLLNLKHQGVLTTPLALGFFRYMTYSFWDRFAVELMNLARQGDTPPETLVRKLDALGLFGELLGYGEDRKLFNTWLDGFQDDIKDIRRTVRLVQQRMDAANRASYAYTLLPGE